MNKIQHFGSHRNLFNNNQESKQATQNIKMTATSKYRKFLPSSYKQFKRKHLFENEDRDSETSYFSLSSLQNKKYSDVKRRQSLTKKSINSPVKIKQPNVATDLSSEIIKLKDDIDKKQRHFTQASHNRKLTFVHKQGDQQFDKKQIYRRQKNLGDSLVLSQRGAKQKLISSSQKNIHLLIGHLRDLQIQFKQSIKEISLEIKRWVDDLIQNNEIQMQNREILNINSMFQKITDMAHKIQKKADQIVETSLYQQTKSTLKKNKNTNLKNNTVLMETQQGINLRVTLNNIQNDSLVNSVDEAKSQRYQDNMSICEKYEYGPEISFTDIICENNQQFEYGNKFPNNISNVVDILTNKNSYSSTQNQESTKLRKNYSQLSTHRQRPQEKKSLQAMYSLGSQRKRKNQFTGHSRKSKIVNTSKSIDAKMKGFQEAMKKIKDIIGEDLQDLDK